MPGKRLDEARANQIIGAHVAGIPNAAIRSTFGVKRKQLTPWLYSGGYRGVIDVATIYYLNLLLWNLLGCVLLVLLVRGTLHLVRTACGPGPPHPLIATEAWCKV